MYLGRHIWISVRTCNWFPTSPLSEHTSCSLLDSYQWCLTAKKGTRGLVHATEISPDVDGALQRSSVKIHYLKQLIPEMQRCPLHPQTQPAVGNHPQRGFEEQEEYPWRDESCSRDINGDGPGPLGHLRATPLSMSLLSGFLSGSSTASLKPGVSGVTGDGWPELEL